MKKLFTSILVGSCLISCGVKVNYDYDRSADFRAYKTYSYYENMDSGLSQLDEQRLMRLLDSTLQIKGFKLAEKPDFLVNIISENFRNAPQNVGVGVGGGGRNVGGGVNIGLPIGGAQQRNIQFDFVDTERDALFWQAISESNYRSNAAPSVREELLRKVVAKVFSKFPPGLE